MRRRTRWILGLLISVATLALLGWLALSVVLPAIVRRQVTDVLRAAGFPDATFQLHASLWRTNLETISAGKEQQLQIGAVTVRYSPLEALAGRVDSVQIRDGKLTIPANDLASGDGSQSAKAKPLPVRSIELQSCTLTLRQGARTLELPLDGALLQTPSGPSQLNLRSAIQDRPITATGTIEPATGRADLSVETSGAELSALIRFLPEQLRSAIADAGGKFSLRAEYHRDAASSHTTARIGLRDVSVVGQGDYKGEIRGLMGRFTIDSLAPLIMPPGQRLSVQSIKLAGQEFADASIEFQVPAPDQVLISSAQVTWASGRFTAGPFIVHPPSVAADLVVSAQHVDLANVLALVSNGRATGTGQLSGQVPVKLDWPHVTLGEGSVQADGPGTLRLGEAASAFGQMLDQSDPRFAHDPQMQPVKQQILDAMGDFAYDKLRADFTRPEGNLLVVIQIQGCGRGGARQPLDITINYRGLEHGLNSYLVARSRVLNLSK